LASNAGADCAIAVDHYRIREWFEVAGPDSVGRRAAFRGSAYCKRTDYPAAATWIDRYFLAGRADLSMPSLLAQAYFQNNDIANCIK
jgi:hypothetical protein